MLGSSSVHAEVRIGAATPSTGPNSWMGEQHERGVTMAVADLNKAGGLLGESIELIVVDDYCEGEQAVAAARKLIGDGVVFVAGHLAQGPRSRLRAVPGGRHRHDLPRCHQSEADRAGLPQCVPGEGEFRAGQVGRRLPGGALGDAKIAILHDGTVYGQGLAEATKGQLNQRGVKETQFDEIVPGQPEYTETVAALEAAGIKVFF